MKKLKLIMIQDPDDDFKSYWEKTGRYIKGVQDFMVKGWETWTFEYNVVGGGYIHPEDNKYGINFPKEWFEVVGEIQQ